MYKSFKIVKVDSKYCDFLRKYDDKVSYNAGNKELRPFIGVLFTINNMEYFAPLSSPKEKHIHLRNTLDLIKIDKGRYGVINLNNMIPVTKKNYKELDLNRTSLNEKEFFRIELLRNQLRWITSNKKQILNKSMLLYRLHKEDQLPLSLKKRCCNFTLLEKKCEEYNNVKVSVG